MFPAARAVLLSIRASEDFGRAEKLSAAEQIKPDCCRTPAVVSILLTPLPVSCPSTLHHHAITHNYTSFSLFKNFLCWKLTDRLLFACIIDILPKMCTLFYYTRHNTSLCLDRNCFWCKCAHRFITRHIICHFVLTGFFSGVK